MCFPNYDALGPSASVFWKGHLLCFYCAPDIIPFNPPLNSNSDADPSQPVLSTCLHFTKENQVLSLCHVFKMTFRLYSSRSCCSFHSWVNCSACPESNINLSSLFLYPLLKCSCASSTPLPSSTLSSKLCFRHSPYPNM